MNIEYLLSELQFQVHMVYYILTKENVQCQGGKPLFVFYEVLSLLFLHFHVE